MKTGGNMKSLTKSKMWLFAMGQFGWALLSGLIGSWLVYFYQPDTQSIAAGLTPLIPQGRVIFGVLTIIGLITAFGRLFDAITDPLVASMSDKCKSPLGRRIPFLKWSAIPLAVTTVLVFCAPFAAESTLNGIWLFIFVALYYFFITAYCTPYTALYSEICNTEKERMTLSTAISLTFIIGTAVAYVAPTIWGIFEPLIGRIAAMRVAFGILAGIAAICMFFPVFFIKEKDYVDAKPVESTAIQSLIQTFKNKDFRIFVGSDIFYWIALTMFQTGLPFFVTALMGLPENMFTPMFVGMTACSLIFYLPINHFVEKFGKKKMVIFAFAMFTLTYTITALSGKYLGFSSLAQGILIVIMGSLPMAIFGILPQAMVADVAEYDAKKTGEKRQGMFFAARTFCFKLGQSIAMLMFTSIATIGVESGIGYRLVAIIAAVFCLIGGIILFFFNEKRILEK